MVEFKLSTLSVQVELNGPLEHNGNQPEQIVENAQVDLCEGEVEEGGCAKADAFMEGGIC
jgi:hypothetical protein